MAAGAKLLSMIKKASKSRKVKSAERRRIKKQKEEKFQKERAKKVQFKKKYQVQEGMGLDPETGGSVKAGRDVDLGRAGKVTMTRGKNFVQSQINKARVAEGKEKVSLQGKVDRGTATAKEKAKLKKLRKADKDATIRQQSGKRGKVKLEKGDYVNTKTGEVITNPESLKDLPGGRDLYVKDPTPPRLEAIKRNAKARGMTGREREMKGLRETKPVYNPKTGKKKYESDIKGQRLPTKKSNVTDKGGTGINRQNMNVGGLKMPTANQVGLKKLPTAVRNKMGYMYGGGMAKKPKMGSMDYRKGGLLLIAVDMMKKKKKKGK